jgi:hypothetical protein
MPKNGAQAIDALKLRVVLIGTIILLLVISAIGFWFFRMQLISYAEQVKTDTSKASISNNDIKRLEEIKQKLQDDSVAVTRAKSIVADSKSYQYQNQIISDITAYAQDAGLHVTSFSFGDTGVLTGTAATATPGSSAPAGLKALTTTVSVKSPANYQAVMRFVHSIENNLTKMQLSGISLTKSADSSTDVTVNPFTIEVYTK